MQQMMVDEAPALWLYQQDTLYAYNSKKVQNWTARTDEVVPSWTASPWPAERFAPLTEYPQLVRYFNGRETGGAPVIWNGCAVSHYPGSL